MKKHYYEEIKKLLEDRAAYAEAVGNNKAKRILNGLYETAKFDLSWETPSVAVSVIYLMDIARAYSYAYLYLENRTDEDIVANEMYRARKMLDEVIEKLYGIHERMLAEEEEEE